MLVDRYGSHSAHTQRHRQPPPPQDYDVPSSCRTDAQLRQASELATADTRKRTVSPSSWTVVRYRIAARLVVAKMCPFRAGSLALVLSLIIAGSDAQRTYRRSCDCEPTADGKCSYTLLLPLAAAGTCSDATAPIGNQSAWSASYEQVAALRGNVSRLSDWLADQARLLAQLQGSVLTMQRAIAGAPLSPGGGSVDVSAVVAQHATAIASLRYNVNNLHRIVDGVAETVDGLRRNFTRLDAVGGAAPSPGGDSGVESRVNRLSRDVVRLTDVTRHLCRKRGLLVSGQTRSILDASISLSSRHSARHDRSKTRLTASGAWCPGEPNRDEWIQFDLGQVRVIYGIVTKGRSDLDQWVTSYKLLYTDDLDGDWTTFVDVLGDMQEFVGNSDRNTLKTNLLWQSVVARYVRVAPIAGRTALANKCMRADVIGCVDT